MKLSNIFKILILVISLSVATGMQAQSGDDDYLQAIERADGYFDKGDYINAKAAYQIAAKLQPDEQYPKDRLQESLGLIKVQLAKNQQYVQKIMIADELFDQDQLEEARKVYQQALEILPDDKKATGKIKEIDDIIRDQIIRDEGYTKSTTEGDQYFAAGEYEKSMQAYEQAHKFKPDEQYPVDQIEEITEVLKGLQANMNEYEQTLDKAEKFVSRDAYENAIEQLELAIKLRPDEAFPKQRLSEVLDLQTQYDNYTRLVTQGDELYIDKDFEQARQKYQEALLFKPDDPYVTNLLNRIDIAQADIKDLNQSSYELAIQKADKLFSEEDYENAMREYQTALHFKPEEAYALKKIEEINDFINFRNSQEEAYSQSILKADKLFKEERYREAKEEFEKARGLKPLEQYPEVKIQEIDNILAGIKSKKKTYDELVAGADKLFFVDDYEEARTQYRTALELFPNEQYPKDQITMINEILGFRDTYLKSLTHADQLLNDENYEDALLEYRKAAQLAPEEDYPRKKISEINSILEGIAQAKALEEAVPIDGGNDTLVSLNGGGIFEIPDEQDPGDEIAEANAILDSIARAEKLQQQYDEAITNADQLFNEQDYTNALTAYQAATGLKPDEQYPKDKIAEIEGLLDEIARAEALDKQYNDLIILGDQQFTYADYTAALTSFQSAGDLKPDEQYPKDKIIEIRGILNAIASTAELQRQYDEAIANADQLFNELAYTDALTAYQAASGLKPDEQYPKDKIAEIEGLLDEIALTEALDKQYNDLIALADQQFANANYTAALTSFQGASNLKPDEQYPKDKLIEIRGILDAIASAEEIQRQYDEAIANADQLFNEQDYTNALTAYQTASVLKPDEQYPKNKIAEIEGLLDEIARTEALDKQYNDLIALADQQFADADYTAALTSFQGASNLKPDEQYPKDKLIEIRGILDAIAGAEEIQRQYDEAIANADQLFNELAYTNALTAYQTASVLKPDEQYPKNKIAEIEGLLDGIARAEALDKQYNDLITLADQQFADSDFTGALTSFQNASDLKPDEQYPKDKLIEIQSILDAIASAAELQQQYDEAIANADQLFNEQDYTNALTAYQTASGLKPDKQYPKDKIAEIEGLLDEIAEAREIRKQYDEAIAYGDKHFNNQDYENAKYEYQVANSVKPDETYPLDKIAEIETIIKEQARLKEIQGRYNTAIEKADSFFKEEQYAEALVAYEEARVIKENEIYPVDQIVIVKIKLAQFEEDLQVAYDLAISKADNYFNGESYEMAKISYTTASGLKPDELYPLDRLKEVNELILRQRQLIQEEYDKAIADADKYYASKIYDNAIESYKMAALIDKSEEYPVMMIRKILKLLSERAIVEINKTPVLIPNNTTKKFAFQPVPVQDRKGNYIFFRASNKTEDDYKLIISFGEEKSKNGGVVVKIPPGAEMNEYIIRISAQYKWFSEDNNWLTMYPEGGDLEVSLIQISHTD